MPTAKMIPQYVQVTPEQLIIPSKSASRKDPTRFFSVGDAGVACAGAAYREFEMKIFPKTGMPYIVSKGRPGQRKIRLIFLPGFGASVSHSGSIMQRARDFLHFTIPEAAVSDRVPYIVNNHSNLLMPWDVAAFDLPGAGWAPPMESFRDGIALAQFIADVVSEINEIDPKENYIITRSGSGSLAIVAKYLGAPIKAIISTAGTYPDLKVARENVSDVIRAEKNGEYKPYLAFP